MEASKISKCRLQRYLVCRLQVIVIPWRRGLYGCEARGQSQRDESDKSHIYKPETAVTIGFPGAVVKGAAFCFGKDLSEWCSCEVCQQMRSICLPCKRCVRSTVASARASSTVSFLMSSSTGEGSVLQCCQVTISSL